MKNKSFISLVALNLVLLGILAYGSLAPTANAQQQQAAAGRAGGRYGMVSGVVQNVYPGVVYIVDEANQEVVAVMWNETIRQFSGVGYRDLKSDAATFQQNR
ncbi:MAG: hypothetical protein FJ292_00865 [Planctomycetes bacterium]|nr:hypothetical protein [Planctomycetota bacterium]